MQTNRRVLAAMVLFCITHYARSAPYLVIDTPNAQEFPARFRIIDKPGMRLIGSAQFTPSQLLRIKNKLHAPIIVVDLRQESHGFVNDVAVSWYGVRNWDNKNKSGRVIRAQQAQQLAELTTHSQLTVYQILSKTADGEIERVDRLYLKPLHTATEEQLATKLGLGYIRFYVPDHYPPTSTQVKQLKRFIQTVPRDTWLYFHCRGGLGRTTTFMVLCTIFKHDVSLTKILNHQIQHGGKNLTQLPDKKHYAYALARKRMHVIQRNYAFQQQRLSHSAWLPPK